MRWRISHLATALLVSLPGPVSAFWRLPCKAYVPFLNYYEELTDSIQAYCRSACRPNHESWHGVKPCTYRYGFKWVRFRHDLCGYTKRYMLFVHRDKGYVKLLGPQSLLHGQERFFYPCWTERRSHNLLPVSLTFTRA